MAVPFDNATTQLTTLSAAMRTFYHENFPAMHRRFGKKTNRLFQPSKLRIDGNGVVVQVSSGNLYGARVATDINGDFPTPRAHQADSYTVTLSEASASNHMRRMAISLQVTHLDIKRKTNSKAAAENFVKELVKQSMENIGESIALHRHLDSTAKVADINGTPKQNDNVLLADASATPAANTGARVAIDGGSIAALPAHLVLDSYTGNTKDGTVEVSDYNPRDNSVGLENYNTTTNAIDRTVSLSYLADNDSLYISGEKDQNILSLGHWFSTPSASDNFFGKDRTAYNARWLRPHRSGPTTARQFTKTDIDNASIELGYIAEETEGGYVVLTTPELEQRYRNEIGNDVMIQFPNSEQKGRLIAQYGFDGNMYRHPHLGRVMLQSDPFAPANKIRFLRIGDWETLFAPTDGGEHGFEWLPGAIGGMWYRMPSSTAGGGDTTTYRADGMLIMCDICLDPRQQAEIINVTA